MNSTFDLWDILCNKQLFFQNIKRFFIIRVVLCRNLTSFLTLGIARFSAFFIPRVVSSRKEVCTPKGNSTFLKTILSGTFNCELVKQKHTHFFFLRKNHNQCGCYESIIVWATLAQYFSQLLDWPYDVRHMVESSICWPSQALSADQASPLLHRHLSVLPNYQININIKVKLNRKIIWFMPNFSCIYLFDVYICLLW